MMTLDPARMAETLSLTEAETGRKIDVRRCDIKRITPCYAGEYQYGLYKQAYEPGAEKPTPLWGLFPYKNLACQITWKDGRDETIVLHHIRDIASGVADLHMGTRLLQSYAANIERIAGWIDNGLLPDAIYVPCNFGLDTAVPFEDPAFRTFKTTIDQVREALQANIPLGILEIMSPVRPKFQAARQIREPQPSRSPRTASAMSP